MQPDTEKMGSGDQRTLEGQVSGGQGTLGLVRKRRLFSWIRCYCCLSFERQVGCTTPRGRAFISAGRSPGVCPRFTTPQRCVLGKVMFRLKPQIPHE